MKKTIIQFRCDNCGKELTHSVRNQESYPFREGWHKLTSLDLEIPKKSIHSLIKQPGKVKMSDLDFCSKKCMLAGIDKYYKNAQNVQNSNSLFSELESNFRQPQEQYPQPQEQYPQPQEQQFRPQREFQEFINPSNYSDEEEVNVPEKATKKGFFKRK